MATSYNWASDEDNGQPKDQGSLLVNDLHPDVTDQLLHTIFQPFGHLRSVQVCRDRRTGWCRGYGFVTFEQRHEAENALLALNFLEILGKPIHITWAQYITVTILARHGDRFAICDALSDFVGLQPYREVCDENDEPKDQEPTESRENSYDEPRPLLVSNSSNDWQEIARTESTEQSWGRRLANTIKSYFIKVMSSPKTLLGIGLLALACTDSFIRSL